MRAATSLLLSPLAALACAGCNPSDFNSLLDKAPVVSFSPEGPSTGSLLVVPLLPPSEPGTTSAARMLVSRKDGDYLGIADFDSNGKATLQKASETDLGTLGGAFVYSGALRSDGAVLVGTPGYGGGETPGGKVFALQPTSDGAGGYSLHVQAGRLGAGRMGMAVAAGNVSGQAPGNFVVLGDDTLELLGSDVNTLLADTNTLRCAGMAQPATTTGGFYTFRPLVVGDLLAGGFDEIVLSNNQGSVLFLQYNGTSTLTCPAKTLAMPPYASFGSSLAVGDFNGDGHLDLAVGAPLDKVHVFFGPLDNVDKPAVTITSLNPTGFGERIASYQAPGTSAAQLLVGDRAGSAVGGPVGGGRVMLFNIAGAAPQLHDTDAVVTLFDSNSEEGQQEFGGTNLGGLAFNLGLCAPGAGVTLVPWASTNLDVLTFFNYVGAPADPRCFASSP